MQTCSIGASGCKVLSTSPCAAGLVCKREDTITCVDPDWADWPMPNSQADVTGGAPNPASYTDNNDGTVTDNVTGLMWQQIVPLTTKTWTDATSYCATLSLGQHSDWRLPSMIELLSIADNSLNPILMDQNLFPEPNGAEAEYWSSTRAGGSTTVVWTMPFTDIGSAVQVAVSNSNISVRCVRQK
jgi:Protein of unknown function (DUF1566)